MERILDELLRAVRVRAVLLLRDCERAELALHPADVRLVQIQVLDEVDLVAAAQLPAREVGQFPERERVVRLHEQEPVLEVEALAGDDLLADAFERRRVVEDRHLRGPVYHGFGDRLELVARFEPVEARECALRIAARDLPRLLDRATRRHSEECAFERSARERVSHDLVLLGREQERQGRNSLAQIRAGDLPGLHRLARAIETVVDDLERDPEREPELAELSAAAGEEARGLEELRRLQRAAGQVLVDRRVRTTALCALHPLAADESEGRVGEDRDRPPISYLRELGERAREE